MEMIQGTDGMGRDIFQAYCLIHRWRGNERATLSEAENDQEQHVSGSEEECDAGVATFDAWYSRTRGLNTAKTELQELQDQLGCRECIYAARFMPYKPRCTVPEPDVDEENRTCRSKTRVS